MDKYYRVDGHSQLVKNPSTGTLINRNVNEIQNARKRKKIRKEKELERVKLEQEVKDLRSEMSEIKSLLQQLVEK